MLALILATLLGAAAQSAEPACLSVSQTARHAAARDPRVDGVRADVQAAEAGFTEALSLRRPQVTAFSRTRSSNSGPASNNFDNQVGVQVSQTLIDFGAARYARAGARNQVRASEFLVQAQQVSSASAAAQAHLDYIQTLQSEAILADQISYFVALRNRLEPLLEEGAATRDAVAAVRSRIAAAQAEATTLELAALDAKTRIAVLIGSVTALCKQTGEDELLALAPVAGLDPLEAGSPGVEALRSELAAARADARRVRRERVPTVSLTALGTYGYDNFRNEWVYQDRIGVDVSVPLYQGDLAAARNARADAEVSRRLSRVAFAERRLTEEVAGAASRIRSLRQLREARTEAMVTKRDELDALEIAFEGGQRTLFELLETRVQLSEARLVLNRVEHQLLSEYLSLASITGNLTINLDTVEGPQRRRIWGWEPDPED